MSGRLAAVVTALALLIWASAGGWPVDLAPPGAIRGATASTLRVDPWRLSPGSWTPANFSGTVYLWTVADDSASLTVTGGALDQWSDKSGRGKHLTRSGASRPTVVTVGGHAAVRFNGSSQYLDVPALGANQPAQVWIAWRAATNPAAEADLFSLGSPTIAIRPYWAGGGTYQRLIYAGANTASSPTGTRLYAGAYVWRVLFSGASSSDEINGTAGLAGNAGTSALSGGGYLARTVGYSYYLACDVHAVVITGAPTDPADVARMRDYLSRVSGI